MREHEMFVFYLCFYFDCSSYPVGNHWLGFHLITEPLFQNYNYFILITIYYTNKRGKTIYYRTWLGCSLKVKLAYFVFNSIIHQ